MDELTKLFEAIAQEKTKNLELEKQELLKTVEKTKKKQAHKKRVQEDFWSVFKSELKSLSEEETANKSKKEQLEEIKEQFKDTTSLLYKEEEEVVETTETINDDPFSNINPERLAISLSEFEVPKPEQTFEFLGGEDDPIEDEVPELPENVIRVTPEPRPIIEGQPSISALQERAASVISSIAEGHNRAVETFTQVVEEEETKSIKESAQDVLSLKPQEKRDGKEKQLQELAVSYLKQKKQKVVEEVSETEQIKRQIIAMDKNIRQLVLGMQGIGGGGEVRLARLDDVDHSSATTDGRFLRYSSSTKKWEGVAIDTGDQAAILDNSGTPTLATGVTASEIRILIDAQESGSYVTLSGLSVGSEASASGDGGIAYNNSTGVFTYTPPDLSTKANLASPALTGNPTAPTQSASDNSTKIATTAYADTAVANIVDSSPAALNTLNELAAALGDDANFSTTVTNSIATKAPLASPALTGTPTAPTATSGTDTTQVATTAFVKQEIDALKALLYAYDQS